MEQDIIKSVLEKIERIHQNKEQQLIAIDGRCASGKTTLAANLQKICGCNVIHMDHFFLRPEQRTPERLNEPGGNVDYERFLQEVLIPLKQREAFAYHPYDCQKQEPAEAIWIEPHLVNVIEGSYCCHPALYEHYDLRVFLDVDKAEQLCRIRNRNGRLEAVRFQEIWIPLEERYFSAYHMTRKNLIE